MTLLEVRDLTKTYPVRHGPGRRVTGEIQALTGVSFVVEEGECFAVVGESGGGKTTLARCILRLVEPSSGEILFDGVDLTSLEKGDLRQRRKDLQMVFQDPYSSLNPRLTVYQALAEPLEVHRIVEPGDIEGAVHGLLTMVGMPGESAARLPHEFSGGQRQRVGIARALATQPRLLVADEPVSALDVSVRGEILNLLADLQRQMALTILLIAHDLGMVRRVADRVAVLYLGQLVELAATSRLYHSPRHPYSVTLMASVPVADPTAQHNRISLRGEVPDPADPPSGCRFHPRCPIAKERCMQEEPKLTEVDADHLVACHFPGEMEILPLAAETLELSESSNVGTNNGS